MFRTFIFSLFLISLDARATPSDDLYFNSLYTKLQFQVDDETVTFDAHELVYASLNITPDYFQEEDKPIGLKIPEYHTYEAKLGGCFEEFLAYLSARYAKDYEINGRTLYSVLSTFAQDPSRVFNDLQFCASWNSMMDNIQNRRNQHHVELAHHAGKTYDDILLPVYIDGFNNPAALLYLTQHHFLGDQKEYDCLKKKKASLKNKLDESSNRIKGKENTLRMLRTKKNKLKKEGKEQSKAYKELGKIIEKKNQEINEIQGEAENDKQKIATKALIAEIEESMQDVSSRNWWINIGGRLTLLRNSPGESEHLYVSDHGLLEEIEQGIKDLSLKFDESGRQEISSALSFWMKYEALDKVQQDHFKKRFVLYTDANPPLLEESPNNLHNLFFWSAVERILRLEKKHLKPLSPQDKFSIGMKDSNLYSPLSKYALDCYQLLSQDQIQEGEEIFNRTLEGIRYKYIRGKTFIKGFFNKLSPFYTQLDNSFSEDDADKFKNFCIDLDLAAQHVEGVQQVLFRPLYSFGSPVTGEAYVGFGRAIEEYFQTGGDHQSSEFAQNMRGMLQGEKLQDNRLYFLPNLTAAWFVSEVARNKNSLITGLMILDLLESGVSLVAPDGSNLYNLKNMVVHPHKPQNSYQPVILKDLYGEEQNTNGKVKYDLAKFDGLHPMTHGGSRAHSNSANIINGTQLSPVRQKEGHIIIHWLYEFLKEEKNISLSPISASKETLEKAPNYDWIKNTLDAISEEQGKRSSSQKELKQTIFRKMIKPALEERLESFGNLLDNQQDMP